MILLIAFGRPTYTSLLIAVFPLIIGWSINIITYGVLRKKKVLATQGPYAFVRNPFYIGIFIADFGMCISANPLDITVAVITTVYFILQSLSYRSQILREEKDLSGLFGDEYSQYCRRTPRLIPSIRAGLKHGGFSLNWSLETTLHNRVLSRAFGVLLWFTFMVTAYIITPEDGSIIEGEIAIHNLFADEVFMSALVAASSVYTMFKVVENVHREEEKRVTTS